jgi:DNA-binding MarR family transcriptional regulator
MHETFALDDHLPFQLNRTWAVVMAVFSSTYSQGLDLKRSELYLMAVLDTHPMSQADHARKTGLGKVPVSRAVNMLTRLGLIARGAKLGGSAKRALTSFGVEVLRRGACDAQALEGRLLRQFTSDEIAQLSTLLKRLCQTVEADKTAGRSGRPVGSLQSATPDRSTSHPDTIMCQIDGEREFDGPVQNWVKAS